MKRWMSFIIVIHLCLFTYPIYSHSETAPDMQVHFIDVGQGDSILIETPLDKTILIDGGPPGSGKKIVSYLKNHGIDELDLLVATHPDMDHIGGLPEVMEAVSVNEILDTGKLHPTRTFANYISEIRKQNIPVQIAEKNDSIEIDPLINIEVWNAYEKFKNNNKSSIVLKVSYKEMDFLLMSDVEKQQEKKIMEDYDVESEIIKVGHHGSKTSSSLEFLQEVNPEVAILTYSKDNNYGHPVDRVIDNLYHVNALIYSTAALGDLVIQTDGEDYFVLPKKDPIGKIIDTAS
ncbi:ComEC/Rec2 family competence protein [Oceanobacillus polygoni]|uniref:Beta-lactamase superfamily II metal-dependent hydrolase n=1 Tax=Oceanobacillus polygoni TaxID=1235259 RepID=A0A9X0YWY0_9BACI|nr:ComEC/Rec2 family competence protein [Oceanobacillus polygoni]MBP2078704.1 beta-lactamase superfamily II metal-dependent hydrolase [Oceanobacillus polygoni]